MKGEGIELEHKEFGVGHVSVKTVDAEAGIIEAVVSVFNNVDSVSERVLPGFFAKSLANKLPKGVWMHDWTKPVGKTLEAKELLPGDPLLPPELKELGGLYIKGQFNLDTTDGREAFSNVKGGYVDEFSIGYRVTKDAYDQSTKVRDLIEGELFEWSPVLVGANRATTLLSAKGDLAGIQPEDLLEATITAIGSLTTESKAGRAIADHRRQRMQTHISKLREVVDDYEDLLKSADDGKGQSDIATTRKLRAEYLRNKQKRILAEERG
jgi:HK97 family phage prohead protease